MRRWIGMIRTLAVTTSVLAFAPRDAKGALLHFPGEPIGSIQLAEASGAAVSRTLPGLLWIVEDAGNGPFLHAVNESGAIQGVMEIAENIDWEDIATDYDPSGSPRLYIADLGDKNNVRPYGSIYRFLEPASLAPDAVADTKIERADIVYEGGPQNVEAFFVDPLTSEMFMISKSRAVILPVVTDVYRLKPSAFDEPAGLYAVAELVGSLPFIARVTSTDISPDGRWILVRSREFAFAFERREGQTVSEALTRTPLPVSLQSDPQGESIAWASDGRSFYTVSERLHSPMFRYRLVPEPVGGKLLAATYFALGLLLRAEMCRKAM
ncbi:MAG TPA: hypothetical protein PJ982_03540 [Lacipirellulaceae bacterium]|nr:hypothetical protein [Lacipirellulaceae bacterium]